MATTFRKISTNERFTVQNDSKRATDMGLDLIKAKLQADRTDGARVNTIFFDRDAAGEWEMIASDYRGEQVIARLKLTVRWYKPTVAPSHVARIDSQMDGGANHMGMLKR